MKQAMSIIEGIVKGCKKAGCSLIGGETAEMPGFYGRGEYDLAGFAVGIASRGEMIDGSEISPGDWLVGLSSGGLHSNGYSLARKIVFDHINLHVDDWIEELGRTIGEELLEPTRIYARPLISLRREFRIRGVAHITGGGIRGNLPKVLLTAVGPPYIREAGRFRPSFPFCKGRVEFLKRRCGGRLTMESG